MDSAHIKDRQAGAEGSLRITAGDVCLERLNDTKRQLRELFERWDNRLTWPVNILEEYCRGTLRIVIKFATVSGRNVRDIDEISATAGDGISRHSQCGNSGRAVNGEGGNGCGFHHEGQDGVLIRITQLVEGIKTIALSSWEDFKRDEKVFYPITGCFYSFARGFVINPVITRGEFEVLILRSAIKSDRLPGEVVERTTEVVSSIAYYEGERLGRVFGESDTDLNLPGMRVVMDAKSVRLGCDELGKFGLKVADVMIGPFDL